MRIMAISHKIGWEH